MSAGHTSPQAQSCGDKHAWLAALYAADNLDGHRNDGRREVTALVVKAVGAYLAHYADGPNGRTPGGNIRPGETRMRAELGASLTQLRAAIRRLIATGHLMRTHRGCHGHAAQYHLALPAAEVGEWPAPSPAPAPESPRPDDVNPPSPLRPDAANPADQSRRPDAANHQLPASKQPHDRRPDAAHPGNNPKVRSGPDAPPRDNTSSRQPVQSPLAQPVPSAVDPDPSPAGEANPTGLADLDGLADAYPGGWVLLQRLTAALGQHLAAAVWADERLGELVGALDDVADAVSPRFAVDALTGGWPADGVTRPAALLLHPNRIGKLRQAAAGQRRSRPAHETEPTVREQPAAPRPGETDDDREPPEEADDATAQFAALPAGDQQRWRRAAAAQIRRELHVTVRDDAPMTTARAAWLWWRGDPATAPADVDAAAEEEGAAGPDRLGDVDDGAQPRQAERAAGVRPVVAADELLARQTSRRQAS